MDSQFDALRKKIIAFRDERDWRQFHDPKNLAEGLTVEAAELLENFLWKKSGKPGELSADELANIRHELADIFVFVVFLCHELDIDLFAETHKKLELNARKYPVEKSRGSSRKYNRL